jgi:uncharacterized protein HemY
MNATLRQRARKLTDLGFALFEAARWREAEVAFRTAAVADPTDEDAWIGLGSSMVRQERFEEAALVLGTAAAIAESSGAWLTLLAAEALIGAGDAVRARQAMAWFDAMDQDDLVTEAEREIAALVRSSLEKMS